MPSSRASTITREFLNETLFTTLAHARLDLAESGRCAYPKASRPGPLQHRISQVRMTNNRSEGRLAIVPADAFRL